MQNSVGDSRGLPVGGSCLQASPVRVSCSEEANRSRTLQASDIEAVLDASDAGNGNSAGNGFFFRDSCFSLPHAANASFEQVEDISEPLQSSVSLREKLNSTGHGANGAIRVGKRSENADKLRRSSVVGC